MTQKRHVRINMDQKKAHKYKPDTDGFNWDYKFCQSSDIKDWQAGRVRQGKKENPNLF